MEETSLEQDARRSDNDDENTPEEAPVAQAATVKKPKKKRKSKQKQRKEELKSKATGTGLKISVDAAPKNNNKIVFDDSNLPSEEEEGDSDGDNGRKDKSELFVESERGAVEEEENASDDDDAVEEVQGTAARDEALDQLKTEAEQSLKTKKKRKRKARPEKETPEKDNDDDDDVDMDEDFFAQLDSERIAEAREQKALEDLQAREAMKGKHTTFVFARNKNDEEGTTTDPVNINENMQVVVLGNSNMSDSMVSEKALHCSRNRLLNGADPLEGPAELKRKRMRSGPQVQPWKRAKKGLSMGRSRLRKGRPSAFFTRKTSKR